MGFLTTKAKVWYPAITDKMQLHTLFSTMASSIENGIQPRLELQERAIGLKASVNLNAYTIPYGTPTNVPYAVSTGRGDFNQGFSFANGIATVQTAGMYLVSTSLGTSTAQNGAAVKVSLYKNSLFIAASEGSQTASTFGTTAVTAVLNCIPGDTISARGGITAAGPSAQPNSDQTTHLSVAMVQAVPQ